MIVTAAAENTWVPRVDATGTVPVPLERVDALQFSEVVYKFVEYYDVEESEAEAIFLETKRWLWLCATSMQEREAGLNPPDLMITGSLFWLDEMWHTFLQFTEQYQTFCHEYLGRFVHHRPTTRAEKSERREKLAERPDDFLQARAAELRRQGHYVCEKLGEETFVRWYREYAGRYSATELFAKTKMRQPAF